MLTQTGVPELQTKLGSLKGKDGKACVRKGCRASAKVVKQAVARTVPKRRGGLARSLKVRSLKRKVGREGVRVAIDARNARGEPYGYFLEKGTKTHIGRRIRRILSGRYAGQERANRINASYQALGWRIRPRNYMADAVNQTAQVALRIGQEAMRDEMERRMAV